MSELKIEAGMEPDLDAPLFPFALSHHRLAERDRCFRLRFRGRPWFICARCLGILLTFLPFLFLHFTQVIDWFSRWPALFLLGFPLPGLLDWAAGRLNGWSSGNLGRVSTGLLLGVGQAAFYFLVLTAPLTPWLWISLFGYGAFAAVVLRGTWERSGTLEPLARQYVSNPQTEEGIDNE